MSGGRGASSSGGQDTRTLRFLTSSPEAGNAQGLLDGESPVSMNFWGFLPGVLPSMEDYFSAFLRALPPQECKGECLIPVYVGDRIRARSLRVAALTTDGSWFGMTYQADRADTAEKLAALHRRGVYPETLF